MPNPQQSGFWVWSAGSNKKFLLESLLLFKVCKFLAKTYHPQGCKYLIAFQVPSFLSIIHTLAENAESPDQALLKSVGTFTRLLLIWVDPCSHLQISESSFLRSLVWTMSRHYRCMGTWLSFSGCSWPSWISWAEGTFCDFSQLVFSHWTFRSLL